MRTTLFTILILLLGGSFCQAQDSALLSKKDKKANIEIITQDGTQLNGRVANITLDYILLDATPYNSPLTLSAYYIRPQGLLHKIELPYIKAAVVHSKKKMGAYMLNSGLDGANVAGKVVPLATQKFSDHAGATATGIVVGSMVGAVKGMGRHKKLIPIHGDATQLMSLYDYYK
ncbi:MAG TPA: hypothetical protein VLC98_06660 [Phnomibacter sp.]|nr:hypothetical protein [Phnomibacter sp.]